MVAWKHEILAWIATRQADMSTLGTIMQEDAPAVLGAVNTARERRDGINFLLTSVDLAAKPTEGCRARYGRPPVVTEFTKTTAAAVTALCQRLPLAAAMLLEAQQKKSSVLFAQAAKLATQVGKLLSAARRLALLL